MAFQNYCSTIIIDATLTDLGRQQLAKGTFNVSKFGLGDDEMDYQLGEIVISQAPPWEIAEENFPLLLEASTTSYTNIKYGLLNYPRQDILFVPILELNQKIEGAAIQYSDQYLIAANTETAKKMKEDLLDFRYVLENNILSHNFVLIESGINSQGQVTTIQNLTSLGLNNSLIGKERYITNLGLQDGHVFIYCDGRFIEELLTNKGKSYIKNDAGNNLYTNIIPLRETIKISLEAPNENYETYYAPTIKNEIFNDYSLEHTNFMGPPSMATAFNFKINPRLISDSLNPPDERYVTFGSIKQELFGGSNKYDYIDTNIMIEGAGTGTQLVVSLRIIRYAGT